MKEQIENLIQHHKTAKQECFELLQELNKMDNGKLSSGEQSALERTIIKAEEEMSWRGVFISDLESLL